MASTTTNMGLKFWNLLSDLFSHTDLQANWTALDTHDHSNTKGVQIPTGGIANGAITAAKLAVGAGFLQVVTVSSSTTAVSGQLVRVSGGGANTITLPAVAPAGQLVGVYSTTTGPVTVATSSLIEGPGSSSGVGSILLGSGGCCAIFLSSPSGWTIVAGGQDSGWTTLPLQSGFTTAGTLTGRAEYRVVGDMAQFRGGVIRSGAPVADNTQFATVPSLAHPLAIVLLSSEFFVSPLVGSAVQVPLVEVNTSGQVLYRSSNGSWGSSTGQVLLDGLTYSLT